MFIILASEQVSVKAKVAACLLHRRLLHWHRPRCNTGGNLKVVNNSDIRNFQNRSRNSSLALCDVSVAYSTDLKKLEAMLKPALAKMFTDNQRLYLSEPRYLGKEELADSGIVLRFAVETDEATVFTARRRLARDLKILFDEKGVAIPFPQVVVHNAD